MKKPRPARRDLFGESVIELSAPDQETLFRELARMARRHSYITSVAFLQEENYAGDLVETAVVVYA